MCRAALCRAVQRKYSGCAVPCAVRYSDCRALQPCRVGECTGRGQEVGQRPLRSRAAHVWYVVCVRDPRRATAGPDTVAVEHLSLVLRFRDTLSAVLLVVGRPRRRRRVLAGLTARWPPPASSDGEKRKVKTVRRNRYSYKPSLSSFSACRPLNLSWFGLLIFSGFLPAREKSRPLFHGKRDGEGYCGRPAC